MNKYFGWNLFLFAYESFAGGRFTRSDRVFGAVGIVAFCDTLILTSILNLFEIRSIFALEIFKDRWESVEVNVFGYAVVLVIVALLYWFRFTYRHRCMILINAISMQSNNERSRIKLLGASYFIFALLINIGSIIFKG